MFLTVSLAALAGTASAAAFEGGGRSPSKAPLIAFGQRYSGQLNNHESDANYNGNQEVALWRIPPVVSHDLLTVNWHVLPYTNRSGFPICMIFVQNVDDFSWGSVFGETDYEFCTEDGPVYSVSGSGSAQTSITVQETNSDSSYLEFSSNAYETSAAQFETYPYDFTVEAPRHYLGVAFDPVSSVNANSVLSAAATRADGSPAADGLNFNLKARWSGEGIAIYRASTSGGALRFPLSLPSIAVGKRVTFQISRSADSEYQEVRSSKLTIRVGAAVATPAAVRCRRARSRVRRLARKVRRLRRQAGHSRGQTRQALLRRKRRAARRLRAARSRARGACARNKR